MDDDYDRDDVRRGDRGHNSRRPLGAMKRELVMRTFMLGRKGPEKSIEINDPMRFAGDGVSFKAKLIGVLEVAAPRGDRLCQEALAELKMAVKAAGEHKQRILICVALDGLRLRDERSGDCLYHHPVHKVSFIAQDMTDTRAFGYIFGSPDQGHRFFGIKTDKGANAVVMSMRDLFQVVYDLKKKEIERARHQAENQALRTNGSHLATSRDSLDKTASQSDTQYGDLLHLESELTSLQEGLHRFENFPQPASGSFDPFEEFGMHSETTPVKRAENGVKSKVEPDPFSMAPFQEKVPVPLPLSTSSATSKSRTQMKELRATSKSPYPSLDMPFYAPPLPPPLAHRSPSNKREEAKKMSTAVPRPSSSNSPALQAPQASPLPSSFSTNFNVDPFPPTDSFVASFPVSIPTPLPSLAIGSPSSKPPTVEPPSGDRYAVFASLSEEIGHQQLNEPSAPTANLVGSPAIQLSTNNATFEADFGEKFDFTAEAEDSESVATKNQGSFSAFDIFTELDPLGTGKIKPYVDKKDFFKDLKKPVEKPALKVLAGDEEKPRPKTSQDLHTVLGMSYKQPPTMSAVVTAPASAPKPNGGLEFSAEEEMDPFGSLHFVPPPEADPFDTDITPAGVFFTPARAVPSSPQLQSKRKNFQATESLSSISFHATLPRGPLKVVLPTKEDANDAKEGRKPSPLRRSDTGSPLSGRKQFTLDDSSPVAYPTLQPPPRHEKTASATLTRPLRQASLARQTPDTPPLPPLPKMEDLALWRLESDQDREQRAMEPTEPHSSHDSLNEPPDPPPRPPLVKPPPLPPKGQPPLPQRPLAATVSLSSSNEEDNSNSYASFSKCMDTPIPPLPNPLRKSRERTKTPLAKTDSDLSMTSSSLGSTSKEPSVAKNAARKKKPKAKSAKADLSQISLAQLSSMSISQLADTLELPAARLTAMTLTELALRLNQLTAAQNKDDDEDEEEECDNGEEDDEEEQEYVTLSDAPEAEDDDLDQEELENEDEVQNLVRAATDSPPSTLTDQTEPQSAKVLEESAEDKYAALREINYTEPEVCLAEQKWPTFDSPLEEEVVEQPVSASEFANFTDFPPTDSQENKTELENIFDQNLDWANPQSFSRPGSVPIPVGSSATVSPSLNFASTFDDDFGRQTPAELTGVKTKATTPSFPRLSRTDSGRTGTRSPHLTRFGSRRESWNNGASDTEADVFGQPAWSSTTLEEGEGTFSRHSLSGSSGGSSGKGERRSQSQPRPSTRSPRSWVVLDVDAGPEWSGSKGVSRKSSSSSQYSQQRASPRVEPPAFDDSFVIENATSSPWKEVESETKGTAEEEDQFADFGAVFGTLQPNSANGKLSVDRDANMKKSQSVNIFKAEGDPFDDEFFQKKQSKADIVSNTGFPTVVEDPFAWVQPFDTFHFQEEFDA